LTLALAHQAFVQPFNYRRLAQHVDQLALGGAVEQTD
jgi:hypothetical protein